jgi:hypothetical protein
MSSVVQVAKRAAYVQRRREEPSSGYNFGGAFPELSWTSGLTPWREGYCPLSPKDILKDRYVCISKTGYGIVRILRSLRPTRCSPLRLDQFSTVWYDGRPLPF